MLARRIVWRDCIRPRQKDYVGLANGFSRVGDGFLAGIISLSEPDGHGFWHFRNTSIHFHRRNHQ